jgi:hypothetical protein
MTKFVGVALSSIPNSSCHIPSLGFSYPTQLRTFALSLIALGLFH